MIFDCTVWAVVKVELARNDDGSICEKDTVATLEAVFDSVAKADKFSDGMPDIADESFVVVRLSWPECRWWQDIEDWACQAGKLAALGVTA